MLNYSFTYSDLEYFLLILVRITSFVYIVPFFSFGHVPGRFRIGLSVVLAILLYGVLNPHEAIVYSSVTGYAVIVLKEVVTGLIIGLGVDLSAAILSITGAVADMELGFSMVTALDPATNEQTSITGVLYQYLIMMILIISGMYEYIIGALAESYTLIPVNGAVFSQDKLLNAAVTFLGQYISIGFQIALPVFAAILMLDVVLGIMAKVSPQMNMFAVGLQLKILAGLVIIMVTINLLPTMSDLIFEETKKMTVLLVEALR